MKFVNRLDVTFIVHFFRYIIFVLKFLRILDLTQLCYNLMFNVYLLVAIFLSKHKFQRFLNFSRIEKYELHDSILLYRYRRITLTISMTVLKQYHYELMSLNEVYVSQSF